MKRSTRSDNGMVGVAARAHRTLLDADVALAGSSVVAMCSGGVDSVVLVHALAQLPRGARPARVIVLWCDHGLRDDVDAERRAAERAATACGASLVVARAARDLARDGGGRAAAARRWRYEEAERVARSAGAQFVATGHTASDQLETALMSLIGVTGQASGVDAMPVVRDLAANVQLVRPLLGVGRVDVETAAQQAGLAWEEDPSNADTDTLVRNAIRHTVVEPLMRASSGAGANLARAATAARRDRAAVRGLADALLDRDGDDPYRVRVDQLRALPPDAAHALVHAWLGRAIDSRELSSRHVRSVTRLASHDTANGSSVDLPGGVCVRRDRYHLSLRFPSPAAEVDQ